MSVNQVNQTTGALSPIAGGTLYADEPIGAILPFGGGTAPSGFLLCNGVAVSRTTYSALFAVIGTSFGAGDGSTTFNVPDLRGKTPFGADTNNAVGTSQNGALPNISGDIYLGNPAYQYTAAFSPSGAFSTRNDGAAVYPSGGVQRTDKNCIVFDASQSNSIYKNGQSTVVPANQRVNYIIKATTISLPSDFEAAVDGKIAALDVASVGGSGKYISAISEADGKISATATNLSTTPTQGSAVPITSGGVYSKFASFDTWTDVTSAAVNLTNVVAASTSIKVYSNGRQCKIVGEYVPTSAQAINDGWISTLTNISIKAGYRPKFETALSGFFAAHHHSPIVWYALTNGSITGYLGTANSETTSIARIPINGMWYIA